MAVVCPGCGTGLPATGRKWHRTSLSRARRNLARPARPGRGGGLGAGAKSDYSQTVAAVSGLRARRIHQPWPAALAMKPAGTSGSFSRVGRKRQALSTPLPGEPSMKPACRYLSLRFQTIQSCSPVRCPITTAVQPWCSQECAYTFRNLTKPAARCIVGLRCSLYSSYNCASRPALLPLATVLRDFFFFHRIRIFAGPMETPLCKISF